MNNHQEYKYGSWIITPDGDKVAINESDRQTRDYLSGIVLWTFKSYIPNATDSYDYKHFVSSVSLKNNSSQEVPLKYTQENTTTVEWGVAGKYFGGKAVWEGENVIGGDYVGIKEELCGAWAIAANEVNYVYDEY